MLSYRKFKLNNSFVLSTSAVCVINCNPGGYLYIVGYSEVFISKRNNFASICKKKLKRDLNGT